MKAGTRRSASRLAPTALATAALVAVSVLGFLLVGGAGAANGPVLDVSDATPFPVTEGNAGTTSVSFNVTLSATPASDVTVSYATQYGSAAAGVDYVYQESSLVFAAGATGAGLTKTVTVNVNGDTAPESNENFFVQLYNPVGASLGDAYGQAVIANDDAPPPQLSVADATPSPVVEGNAGTTPASFAVALSATPGSAVTVKYATNYGTAAPGSDYVYAQGTLTFPAGSMGPALTQTVTVQVNGDTIPEGNEPFFLQLYDASGAAVSDAYGQAVIQNDDAAVPVIVIANATSVEGTNANFGVTLSSTPSTAVSVKFATMPGTYFNTNATPGTDFTPASGTLNWSAGATGPALTQTISVPILADGVAAEPSEIFYVQVYDPVGGNLAAERYGRGAISAPPIAVADAFTAVGNTKLAVGVAVAGEPVKSITGPGATALFNDTDPENDPLSVGAGNIVSTNGGSVTMNANGTFTYLPAAGFVGASDTFTYSLSDGFGNTVMGTVTINFSGRVWYVNNALGPAGDGRSTSPFNSLAPLTTGGAADPLDGSSDVLFLYQGSGNYGGGIVLETNQQLVGQPQGLVVGSDTLLPAGGTNPTVTNAAGAGITLGQGNLVRRVNVAGTSGAGITGTGVNTVDVGPSSSVTNTTGPAFGLAGSGNGTITFAASISQSSTSGRPVSIQNRTGGTVNMTGPITANNAGILLDTNAASINLTGLVTLNMTPGNQAVTISGAGNANVVIQPVAGLNAFATSTGNTVDINGAGTGSITIDGTVAQTNAMATTATAVSVQNHSGGTVSFPKQVTSTNGAGIRLTTNPNTTINFSAGAMNLSTGARDAFAASGGGTVNVTGLNNAITTTTGVGLSVVNTNIGSSNLNFRSISSNGAVNGILLNNTGGSGGLTVAGAGSAGTGGTIQGSTNSGIEATNTTDLNLSWMNIQNNGNALNEGGLRLVNVFGTGQLTSSMVTGSSEDNVYLSNSSGTLAGFTIQGPGCTIGNNSTSDNGNTGISVLATVTSTMNVTINNCAFSGNRTDTIHTDTADASSLSTTITNNVITAGTGGANQGNIGINVSSAGTSTLNYLVQNNKIGTNGVTDAPLMNHGINLFAGNTSTITGKVLGNTIVNAGAGMSGTGIRIFQSDSGTLNAKVDGNTVSNVGFDFGIDATDNGSGIGPSTGKLNVGVTNNNVSVLSTAINAIRVRGRRDTTTCARISGDTATTNGGAAAISASQANTAVYNLEIVPPPPLGALTAAQVAAELATLNTGTTEASAATAFTGVAVGSCTGIPS